MPGAPTSGAPVEQGAVAGETGTEEHAAPVGRDRERGGHRRRQRVEARLLLAHGAANEVVPLELARRDFLALYGAGADVLLSTYPCTHTIHPNMLRDINRWVIRNVDYDACWDSEEDEFEE